MQVGGSVQSGGVKRGENGTAVIAYIINKIYFLKNMPQIKEQEKAKKNPKKQNENKPKRAK